MSLLLYLAIGLVLGLLIGYLTAERKAANMQATITRLQAEADRARQQYEDTTALMNKQREETAILLGKQREETEAMRQSVAMEFENLSNRIFQRKADDMKRLNAEQIENLLRPLDHNLKEFKLKVEQAYSTEAKERFSLSERIKELVELNNRLSEEANNLTRALKGDSKMQGNWGEMILERLLQASGLIEGEHYTRQEFLKNEQGEVLVNEENGQKMQPDIIVKYPGNREMIIDSKVSLTAYTDYTQTDDKEQQARCLKAHLISMRKHVDELSEKDYSRYDAQAPDFVVMFIPTEGAYLLAVQTDNNLWEYAYNKKVVLMSPTNLISALRLSLDLWKRENQVKNIQAIIKRGTSLYEKVVNFCDTFLSVGDRLTAARRDYDRALKQLSQGNGCIVHQAEQLRSMSLTPKKRISPRLLPDGEPEDEENES